jgi:HEAT repeat protein
MRGGRIVVEHVKTHVDELLSMLDDPDEALLDELARDPSNLVVENVDENSARRLRLLVRGGGPEVRLLAVRALGRSGNLDYVPALIYALTDPDRRIVLEARDGLQFMSRRFEGFGPPDDFTEQQRYEAVNAWKGWYLALRPSASLEP